YNLAASRLATGHSEDLALGSPPSPEKLRTALRAPFQQLRNEVESGVSEGTLLTASHRLIVESLDSYRIYQQLEGELGRIDFVDQAVLKRAESKLVEFELLTPARDEEISQRLA